MKVPSLQYVTDEAPGYTRKRWGRGFSYFDAAGKRIKQEAVLERIKALAIPPAWTEVWIAPSTKGHLQATGRDEKGRKQYIYHEKWMDYRQAMKFQRLIPFVEVLPEIRRTTKKHLRKRKWSLTKVLALIVQVMDETAIRIGNQYYKNENETFGLTTMRRKHMEIEGTEISFSFRGKSKKYQEVAIDHPRLVRLIKDCSELPGYEVFRYLDEEGRPRNVDSQDINDYLRKITGEDYTSKDFRTWAGTAATVQCYPEALKEVENSRKKIVPTLVGMVSEKLGNTSAVCRKYYIHPTILELAEKKALPAPKDIDYDYPEDMQEELEPYELVAYALLKEPTVS